MLQDQPETLTGLSPAPEHENAIKVSFFRELAIGRVGISQISADGVALVASSLDLLATKLKVLLQRAERKDYQDVAALLGSGLSLAECLGAAAALYGSQFPARECLKALVYFADGDLAELGLLGLTTSSGTLGTWTLADTGDTIEVKVLNPNPPTSSVPGPLPVLGAGAAFGFSRRLRQRIQRSKAAGNACGVPSICPVLPWFRQGFFVLSFSPWDLLFLQGGRRGGRAESPGLGGHGRSPQASGRRPQSHGTAPGRGP